MKTASELITAEIWHIFLIALLTFFISSGSCLAYTLTINPRPSSGTVTSNIGGINCGTGGPICSATFTAGTQVTLTTTPASSNYTFDSWNVGQTSLTDNPITIPMIQNLTGSVTFTYHPPVNGVCGSDNGIGVSGAPVNLCTSGTPSEVTGSGPWEWSCQGLLNGTNASCQADILTFSQFAPPPHTFYGQTSTLLQNGKLLIAGGVTAPATIFDPAVNSWSPAGILASVRQGHVATMLPNGKVLVTGGINGSSTTLATAEIYDPSANNWSPAASMSTPRNSHTATLLSNGRVLVAGGSNGSIGLDTTEIYDYTTNTWSPADSMAVSRMYHSATLLPDGRVLVAGGGSSYYTAAELYDPGSNTWSTTGNLTVSRHFHSATLLANGKVLVAGGRDDNTVYWATTELYDPGTNNWSSVGSMASARSRHTASLLPDGTVLISGGLNNNGSLNTFASAERFDPATNTWSTAGSMATIRYDHTATLMPDGSVAIVGGMANSGPPNINEKYNPAAGSWSAAATLAITRRAHSATLLPNGKVLVAGGADDSDVYHSSGNLYNPATNSWAAAGNMATARQYHTATLLTNGKVLVAGGYNGSDLASAELYDPATNSWSPGSSLITARTYHTATLLANGRVLIAGGMENGSSVMTSELYDPATNSWSAASSMATGGSFRTATLLANGKVLVAGSSYNNISAELYDPATNSWSVAGNLITPRREHAATLLPSGKVLVAGGWNGGELSSAELYDPGTNSWSAAGSMTIARWFDNTATLLPDGRVLVTGRNSSSLFSTADLYDPATNSWAAAGSLTKGSQYIKSTLLLNGKVLATVGRNPSAENIPAELFDPGPGFPENRRPLVTGMAFDYVLPNMLVVNGSGLRGDSESSSGGTSSSSTGYPLLHLQRIDNGQSLYISPNPSLAWSDTAFYSTPISGLPAGHYRATIHVNGIPSLAQTVLLKGYNVTFTSGAGGTITDPAPQYVFPGVPSSPVYVTPNSGYYFLNWTGDNGFATTSEYPLVIRNLSADTNITARFTLNLPGPSCGSAHNTFSASMPAGNLCTIGAGVDLAGEGPWTWNCGNNLGSVACSTTAEPTLRVTLAGSGSGSVTISTAQGNSQCLSGTCPLTFPYLAALSLAHTANSLSVFGGWSGACSNSAGNCDVMMTGDKPVIATFNVADKARIGSTGFASVSLAYGSVSSTTPTTITTLDANLAETVNMNQPWNIILWGGWKADYSATSGLPTILHGLTVSNGSLKVKKGIAIR